MPRPNKGRTLYSEQALAERVAAERALRGWTFDELAQRMTDAGCAINGSAVYKIEKGRPRRRITVDEHVAFSRVFELPLEELLTPPAIAASAAARAALNEWLIASTRRRDAEREELSALDRLHELVVADEDLAEVVREMILEMFGADPLDQLAGLSLVSQVTRDDSEYRARMSEVARAELERRDADGTGSPPDPELVAAELVRRRTAAPPPVPVGAKPAAAGSKKGRGRGAR